MSQILVTRFLITYEKTLTKTFRQSIQKKWREGKREKKLERELQSFLHLTQTRKYISYSVQISVVELLIDLNIMNKSI